METVSLPAQRTGDLIPRETIDGVISAIVENFSPEQIVLFGSYASDEPTPDSDLDLLVVMHTDLPRHKRAVPMHLLFRPVPCSMDILVYTPAEVAEWKGTVNHIITEAFRQGRIVYERQERTAGPTVAQKG
ncbi:nucleotidyltransferase domain-containing protein [Candidatus Sumerlaeota bacterium]|nr:nucleotidyltransferase domain-containing protein [Candidatus Sumerlaeota bacterium]